jgi:hypothetical protein
MPDGRAINRYLVIQANVMSAATTTVTTPQIHIACPPPGVSNDVDHISRQTGIQEKARVGPRSRGLRDIHLHAENDDELVEQIRLHRDVPSRDLRGANSRPERV